ncbi:MAG TPA: toll/interleukin-1 receptor domain-containing protein [Ktedonobacterales bacterium]|nr:toll/interleukin-1 receptor domain-containing protein [Ktedonobacterales bacterium]
MAAQQLRVFVSHASEDNAFCHAIVMALRDAGADVWYDEHNMGSGRLQDVILREMGSRPIFVLILSKAVFTSKWVKRETDWAEELGDRDPSRVFLPVTAGQIERNDFGADNGWLAYYNYKRIEAPGFAPYTVAEAANRLLRALGLTPAGAAPTPVAPQPTESVDDLLTRGKALIAQKQYAEALPLFERVSQLSSGSFDAWANMGYILGELGQWQNSLASCERALALDSKQSWVWNNKGRALNGLTRYNEALDAYDRALALDQNDAEIWYNKGTTLHMVGRYDDALAAYDRALALDANLAVAWGNRGTALDALKRYDEALVAYERGLSLNPNNANDWNNKAHTLRALGRTAEAEQAKNRAKELGWQG